MKVQYTAAILDSSGYAEAARNNVSALLTQPNIQLQVKVVSFENWRTDLGDEFKPIQNLIGKKFQPDINIIHLTPDNFPQHIIPGIKNIGFTVWETSRLPSHWVSYCNMLSEIWVPCDWNIEVFKASGVVVPVRKVPHSVNLSSIGTFQPHKLDMVPTDTYNFYSIFQWSARKNPEGLIAAYLSEFKSNEKVSLVLKTFINNNTNSDKQLTVSFIKEVKQQLQLHDENTAQILLLHGGLSRSDILNLHSSCDCFVLPHRAEGWGVPHFEAMAMNRPVITTGFSGNLEFMSGNTSYLTSFNMVPVKGMNRPTYNGWMDWAEPSLDNLRYYMRHVFEHQQEARDKAKVGLDFINKFDWKPCGELMMRYLCV